MSLIQVIRCKSVQILPLHYWIVAYHRLCDQSLTVPQRPPMIVVSLVSPNPITIGSTIHMLSEIYDNCQRVEKFLLYNVQLLSLVSCYNVWSMKVVSFDTQLYLMQHKPLLLVNVTNQFKNKPTKQMFCRFIQINLIV